MAKSFLGIIFAGAVSAAFLMSCVRPAPYIHVVRGNNAFSRGEYQKANIEYIKALEAGVRPSWISYDIANVYYALGEAEAAQVEWQAARGGESTDLLFRTLFNEAVLAFELGQYEKAYSGFRTALELDPKDIDAKINLELSLEKMDAKPRDETPRVLEVEQSDVREGEVERILDYLRRKEEQLWLSTERIEEDTTIADW